MDEMDERVRNLMRQSTEGQLLERSGGGTRATHSADLRKYEALNEPARRVGICRYNRSRHTDSTAMIANRELIVKQLHCLAGVW